MQSSIESFVADSSAADCRVPGAPADRFGSAVSSTDHEIATRFACHGDFEQARRILRPLIQDANTDTERAALLNDLAALAVANGHHFAAERGWRQALKADPRHSAAQRNLAMIERSMTRSSSITQSTMRTSINSAELSSEIVSRNEFTDNPSSCPSRIAILSLLFNWPSTGGGTVHTKELADALQQSGCEVRHIYAVYPAWGIGKVTEPLSVPHRPLEFHEFDWTLHGIQDRFRDAVDEFAPDAVIICDSWNSKVILAEAVAGYPYFLTTGRAGVHLPAQQRATAFRKSLSGAMSAESIGGLRQLPAVCASTRAILRRVASG